MAPVLGIPVTAHKSKLVDVANALSRQDHNHPAPSDYEKVDVELRKIGWTFADICINDLVHECYYVNQNIKELKPCEVYIVRTALCGVSEFKCHNRSLYNVDYDMP